MLKNLLTKIDQIKVTTEVELQGPPYSNCIGGETQKSYGKRLTDTLLLPLLRPFDLPTYGDDEKNNEKMQMHTGKNPQFSEKLCQNNILELHEPIRFRFRLGKDPATHRSPFLPFQRPL